MEPIILINMLDMKADIPAQLIPIFGLAVKSVDHFDNRNNREVPDEERNKVTRKTWDVIAIVGTANLSLYSYKESEKADAARQYGYIVSAICARQRTFEIDKTDERSEDAETDRLNEDDGCPRESCYPAGHSSDDGRG